MVDPITGEPHTAHTTNLVPVVLVRGGLAMSETRNCSLLVPILFIVHDEFIFVVGTGTIRWRQQRLLAEWKACRLGADHAGANEHRSARCYGWTKLNCAQIEAAGRRLYEFEHADLTKETAKGKTFRDDHL